MSQSCVWVSKKRESLMKKVFVRKEKHLVDAYYLLTQQCKILYQLYL